MAGGVDEVELVDLAAARRIVEGDALGLDGNAALALDIHGIEHLLRHLPLAQAPAVLDKAVREGGFAVVNVRDNRKIADVA